MAKRNSTRRKAQKPNIAEAPLSELAAATVRSDKALVNKAGAELTETTKQIRLLQSRVFDVMNLCDTVLDAAYSDRRGEEEDNFETKGTMRIAARELEAIAGGLDIAATALEVAHG